ncbi:response regulator [uncultured Oscillibacter sp.]|uniref:response regulator n=1 Tax=uncultured Oscillibacter sp. TaxID=876091 RepID=UPI002804293E|nr:response regulator [uncultured Oscillibacter sp.]
MYRVIIVEDDPEIARTTKSYVEKHPDFQVKAIFSNGQEALNNIWLSPVDLIVLDLYMPQMNGKEFLYRLRKENFQVDVIVVTAANDAENIREVLPFGVVDYLLKPFEAARFAEALERFSQRHQIISAISGLDQERIDVVFSDPAAGESAARRARLEEKGLKPLPYQALLDFLEAHRGERFPAEALAEAAGLSKVSVRRYLSEMIEAREIASDVDIRAGSRPTMVYRRTEEDAP